MSPGIRAHAVFYTNHAFQWISSKDTKNKTLKTPCKNRFGCYKMLPFRNKTSHLQTKSDQLLAGIGQGTS